MSKKLSFAKLFSAIACLPVVGLSTIACLEIGDNDKNEEIPIENGQNASQSGETTDNNTQVSDGNEEISELNGVYGFSGALTVNDIVYDDVNELLNFFNVRNLASVKSELLKLGFEDFIKSVTEIDGNSALFLMGKVAGSETSYYLNIATSEGNETYKIKPTNTYSIEATEEGYVVNDDSFILSYDSEKNEITILVPFTYTNESGTTVETPVYLKATLSFISSIVDMNGFSKSEYSYSSNSAVIVASDADAETNAVAVLKEKLGLADEDDALEFVASLFSSNGAIYSYNAEEQAMIISKTYYINENEYDYGTATFIYAENGVYSINGLDFTIEASETSLKLVCSLTENATLELELLSI